ELEQELDRLYREGGQLGYWAKRAHQLFAPGCKRYVGGVEGVRRIVSKGPGAGFAFAVKYERLDLLVENLVLSPKWKHLFTPELQRKADENLATISKQREP